MPTPQEKQADRSRIVALLAEESQLPAADVAKLYEQEHAALAAGAHITTYLDIFAIRNVQAILRQRAADNLEASLRARPALAA